MGNVNENASRPYCGARKASGDFFHATVFDLDAGKLKGRAIDTTGALKDSFELAVP
jgi:hypothetical protein